MSKFTKLVEHLRLSPEASTEIRLTFAEIGDVIGQPLPPSAATHPYWHGRGHRPHVDLLANAGWSAHLDPKAKAVRFRRLGDGAAPRVRGPVVRPVAGASAGVADRDGRVRDLTQNLQSYVQEFTRRQLSPENRLFAGPSVYFHKRTIQRLRQVGLRDILSKNETEFYELLYATLVSWGMHRMGPGGAKLVGFEEFRSSLLDAASGILALRPLKMHDLDGDSAADVADQLGEVMKALTISRSNTQMVACSKALHHLLPELVPPMDREYTLWFFYAPSTKTSSIDRLFREVYCGLAGIAFANRRELPGLVTGCDDLSSGVFDTSETKLIDNAIMEYVINTLGRRKSRAQREQDA